MIVSDVQRSHGLLGSRLETLTFNASELSGKHVQRKEQEVDRQADPHAPKTDEHGQRCRHGNYEHPGSYALTVLDTDKVSQHVRL